MKIIVSVKQVPSRDSALRPDPSGTWLDDSDLTYEMNEPDAYALEEALQLREKLGGEVIVVSAGPSRVQQTIREALAKGADRGIHVELSNNIQLDAFGFAQVLTDALKLETPDLILTGLQSDDMGFGQTGVILAELLGFAHATIVVEVELSDKSVRVKRELEDGWYQHVVWASKNRKLRRSKSFQRRLPREKYPPVSCSCPRKQSRAKSFRAMPNKQSTILWRSCDSRRASYERFGCAGAARR